MAALPGDVFLLCVPVSGHLRFVADECCCHAQLDAHVSDVGTGSSGALDAGAGGVEGVRGQQELATSPGDELPDRTCSQHPENPLG